MALPFARGQLFIIPPQGPGRYMWMLTGAIPYYPKNPDGTITIVGTNWYMSPRTQMINGHHYTAIMNALSRDIFLDPLYVDRAPDPGRGTRP